MANKEQVAKLKQRNLVLAGENTALRQELDKAYQEIEHLHAKIRFIAKDWEVGTSLLPPPRPDLPESVANHGDELLHSLQSLAKEMIRDAR